MKESDLELLQKLADFEASTPREEWPLGWAWRDVGVWPAALNRLVVDGFLKIEFKSNSTTGYALTPKAWDLLQGKPPSPEGEKTEAMEPLTPPEDLFQDIIGHDEVKELLRACLLAAKPVHVLLSGPPALAKSLFLWELERVAGDRACWALGSSTSRAGLLETLLTHRPSAGSGQRPWLLLVDELERMSPEDQGVLLSIMEGGRLVRTKVGRMAEVVADIRVVAACNRKDRLAPELLSRFAIRRLYSYSPQEYRQVVEGVLTRREGCAPETAREIAERLADRTVDVRDSIRVARLAPQLGVEKAVRLLIFGPMK